MYCEKFVGNLGVGPRGGFKYLSFEYRDKDDIISHISIGVSSEAKRYLDIFDKIGIKVKKKSRLMSTTSLSVLIDLCADSLEQWEVCSNSVNPRRRSLLNNLIIFSIF